VQVALALVMLVSSGLMIRTFQNLLNVDPGFDVPSSVQTVRVTLPASIAPNPDRGVQVQRQIRERLAAIPGVESAGYIDQLPLERGLEATVANQDKDYPSDQTPPVRRIKAISPGLLSTLGTRLLGGRDFDWSEIDAERNVVIVSESMARAEWNSIEGALGQRVLVGTDGTWQEVVGVVADISDNGVDADPPPIVYWPAREHPLIAGNYFPISVAFTLRTDRAGTLSLNQDIRRVIRELVPDLPLASVQTLSEVLSNSMARTAFSLVLLGIAGAMSLAISIVGIYGVLAYAVMQRRREVGIRLALGAEPQAVRQMFVWRGLALSGVGIAIGVVIALGVTQMLESMLFGVAPADLLTFTAAAGFLAAAALIASYIPARRAAGVEPSETLRGQ
jgi:putative ABC transport system permease protein